MKVSELIEALQCFPQDLIVITEGYEDGYDTIKEIKTLNISANSSNHWWNGEFIKNDNPFLGTDAVFLFSRKRTS